VITVPTNTQKNFKKQMAQIQKQINEKAEEEVFSYIENDHIRSYYSPKKSRKVRNFSIGSIVFLMITAYSIYARIKPLSVIQKPDNLYQAAFERGNGAIFSSTVHKKIVEYLSSIRPFENKASGYLNNINIDFNKYVKDNRALLLSNLSVYKKRTEEISSSISNIEPPSEMSDYHKRLFDKINSIYYYFEVCERAAKKQKADDINIKINNINLCQKLLTAELLKVFDENGIKYEKTPDGIKYWYQD
jgi:regulator of replication initiation timing